MGALTEKARSRRSRGRGEAPRSHTPLITSHNSQPHPVIVPLRLQEPENGESALFRHWRY